MSAIVVQSMAWVDKYGMRRFINLVEFNTNTPEFRSWFGDSVVVDENGEPLRLYHGTSAVFDEFKEGTMIWASVGPQLASQYSEFRRGDASNVRPLYMRIVHPLDADAIPECVTVREFFAAVAKQAGVPEGRFSDHIDKLRHYAYQEESGPHYSRHDFWLNEARHLFTRDGADLILRLLSQHFDGIRMHEMGTLTYGAFSPLQVRSVFL